MIEFNKDEKDILTSKLRDYCENEFSVELGRFDAEFLLEFISKEVGSYYYNRGLQDAHKILEEKVEEIKDNFFTHEKPTDFEK